MIGGEDWTEVVRLAITVASAVASFAVWIYAVRANRDKAQRQELAEIWRAVEVERQTRREDDAAMRDRLARAEARLDDAPTSKGLHELALSIEHFGGDLRAVLERVDGLGKVIERLERVTSRQEQYLMDLNRQEPSR